LKYFLSLGTNLGDRRKNLSRAVILLEKQGMKVINSSSLYETQPVDFYSQPMFYNKVIEVESELNPERLLIVIKRIEKNIGRKPAASKGPRLIDIDILIAENTIIHNENLEIPHRGLPKRNFVMIPFNEISPDMIHPVLKEKIKDLLKKSEDKSVVNIVNN